MKDYIDLYQRNKKLDKIYQDKYVELEEKFYQKNCLELIVELCEFANGTKCFKYWSVKKPNREYLLEEYADCILMVLYFFNQYNVDVIETSDIEISNDILIVFNELIRMCTNLMDKENVDERLIKDIFTYLLHIGKLLEVSNQEILDACYNKIIKNEERLNNNY